MIKKIIQAYKRHTESQEEIKSKLNELIWADNFHDSVRGLSAIENLSLNIGRWAGGYPFFYCLLRVLNSVKPKKILEFGLGESSKLISCYISNYESHAEHIILEHDQIWIDFFLTVSDISSRSTIVQTPIIVTETDWNNSKINYTSYELIATIEPNDFDFFVVDGPFGTNNYSRFDIAILLKKFNHEKEFIILLDDTNRAGEKQTLLTITNYLAERNINFFIQNFEGLKSSTLIASSKYKFMTSI